MLVLRLHQLLDKYLQSCREKKKKLRQNCKGVSDSPFTVDTGLVPAKRNSFSSEVNYQVISESPRACSWAAHKAERTDRERRRKGQRWESREQDTLTNQLFLDREGGARLTQGETWLLLF